MSPGCQLGSSGQVVAHKCFMLGTICHHARLALGSTLSWVCAATDSVPSRTRVRKTSGPHGRSRRCMLSPGTGRTTVTANCYTREANSRLRLHPEGGKPPGRCREPSRPGKLDSMDALLEKP